MASRATAAALSIMLAAISPCPAADLPRLQAFLDQGKLAEAESYLADDLKANPEEDLARFGLGAVQFFRAVEGRIQAFYRHGLRSDVAGGFLPLTNLPVPNNPKPELIDAARARALLQAWVDDLAKVEATLAGVTSPDVKLRLNVATVRLDFDGDGAAGGQESLGSILGRFNRQADLGPDGLLIAFDRADVDWLRGYCHLLSAVADFVLAHDFEAWFRESAHLIFAGAPAPHRFIVEERLAGPGNGAGSFGSIADIVAAVHLVRFPVAEPAKLTAVLSHLEATVALSRSSWKSILAETDDDREWVPNPGQASVTGARVAPEMVKGWTEFLDEFGAILAAKKLVPFWRGTSRARGVNLRKALTEPRPFDLVLWVQGSAAVPYLEDGAVSAPETWSRLNRVFRGEFIGFAIWFN